ncbi:MAG: type II toxin-antitoxin system VapC family toxin [Candidatus Thorarchaeota archaeon]|nr:type II toxin-antitoxin system VapC family toxin [Candidatus Thorarchaeota archaeon]
MFSMEEHSSSEIPAGIHYLDTCVLLNLFRSYSQGDYPQAARDFLEKIEQGQAKGLVSNLTLCEIIGAIRTASVYKKNIVDKSKIEEILDKVLRMIYQIENIIFFTSAEDGSLDKPSNPIFLFQVLQDGVESLRKENYQIECVNPPSEYRFRGLNINDLIHLRIASELGCDYLATFDKGFWIQRRPLGIYDVKNQTER